MSKTEQDLDTAAVDDALDDEFVDSIEEYASDADQADDADSDDAGDDPNDGAVAEDVELESEDVESEDVESDAVETDGDVDALDDSSGAEAMVFEDDDFTDEDFDDDDRTFEVPKIVSATEGTDDDQPPEPVDPELLDPEARERPEVSDDILEELRQADIDGPVVDMAPQDDTTSARRRPKRAADYDPAPVPIPLKVPRILGRKPRVRKVTRVVRHVDPWSVFKIAVIANLVLYVIVLTAGVLLWNVAYATGTVENVERFFESFGWSSFDFKGGEIYHAAWIAGLFGVLGLTGLAVLIATLFNLITDLVGGVRFTVLEEEVVESRTSPMRRFVVRRPEPEIPAISSDGPGAMIREAVVDDSGSIPR